MPKSRKPKITRAARKLLTSKVTFARDIRGRFVSKKDVQNVAGIYSRKSFRKLATIAIIPSRIRSQTFSAKSYFSKYRSISRAKPAHSYFHSGLRVFSNRKAENGDSRFTTIAVFSLVQARLDVKTSEKTGELKTQVWVRRIMRGGPTMLRTWAHDLEEGHDLWEEVKTQVEFSGGTLLEIIGFEGVR